MPRSQAPTITGGTLRGRRLQVPPGRSVRPTRSLVRQALFNMLGPKVVGARVLDLYSGSGALGLEALSRGAASVVFVERGRQALACLRANLSACAVPPDRGRVLVADAARLELTGLGPFELVLADPPFARLEALPPGLSDPGALAAGAVLAVHLPSERPAPDLGPGWRAERTRLHGRSGLHLFVRTAD